MVPRNISRNARQFLDQYFCQPLFVWSGLRVELVVRDSAPQGFDRFNHLEAETGLILTSLPLHQKNHPKPCRNSLPAGGGGPIMASGRGTIDDRRTWRLLKTDSPKRRVHNPRSGAEQRSDGKQATDKLVGSNAVLFARVASFPEICRWYHASMYPENQRRIVGFSLLLCFDVVYPIPWYTS